MTTTKTVPSTILDALLTEEHQRARTDPKPGTARRYPAVSIGPSSPAGRQARQRDERARRAERFGVSYDAVVQAENARNHARWPDASTPDLPVDHAAGDKAYEKVIRAASAAASRK